MGQAQKSLPKRSGINVMSNTSCAACLKSETCSMPGEIGTILCYEGLYSQLLMQWRDQRESGSLANWSQHLLVQCAGGFSVSSDWAPAEVE